MLGVPRSDLALTGSMGGSAGWVNAMVLQEIPYSFWTGTKIALPVG
jgi:hypothetical protein